MADLTVTSADVSPLPHAYVRGYDAGGALTLGDAVYLASDGDVEEADASVAGTAHSIGMVVGIVGGKTTAVAGDRVQVAQWGPVAGFSGLTPGDAVYVSDTAGAFADAAGTVTAVMGRVIATNIVFFQPVVSG